MVLNLFLVDCGLELIPKEIRDHPSVKKNIKSKNYSSQVLDNSLHHSAMVKLNNFGKRGRPDILHNCLLNALGSPLNKNNLLKIYFHTINNRFFELNPEIRISRNYNRFKGLIAKLLIDGSIQFEDNFLIKEIETELGDMINSIKNREIFLFSSKGILIQRHLDLFHRNLSKNYIAVIGGFQKGTFSKQILELSNNLISISQYALDAWIVVNKVISFYEIINNIK
ncbi:MAG: 16S rRNA methyltransferase [Candidatus Hodarchaeota archaeon]